MNTLKTTLSIGSALLLSAGAFAQQSGLRVESVPGPVKDRGTFNVATGAWTRSHDANPSKVLYNNNVNTGSFGVMSVPMEWYSNGRLPGTNDPNLPNAKADSYLITGFQIAYCTSQGPAGQDFNVTFFEAYTSCTNPVGATAGPFSITGPGSAAPGVLACWVVTIDFTGTTLEFKMEAEADGIFEADCAFDSFGWCFGLKNVAAGPAGPLLAGDPINFPPGDGTYYKNPGNPGTGLCTQDQFWLFSSTGVPATGCYWFGGYPANPFASFWLQLYGKNNDTVENCTKYCAANPNSTGAPASISSSCFFVGRTLDVNATPVPNQPGIFFHALNQAQTPFGNGFLCATGGIVRTGVVFPVGNRANHVINFAGFNGTTRYVQYWYRDPAGGGFAYNTSNALCVEVPN